MNRWLAVGGTLIVIIGCSSSTPVEAQKVALVKASGTDWPTFRGANRDSISGDKGLLKSWPKDGPAPAWPEPAKDLGAGFSSVSVVGDKIFTMGDKGDSCYVFALERATGKKLWDYKIGGSGAPGGYAGPRCTPTVEGDLVF